MADPQGNGRGAQGAQGQQGQREPSVDERLALGKLRAEVADKELLVRQEEARIKAAEVRLAEMALEQDRLPMTLRQSVTDPLDVALMRRRQELELVKLEMEGAQLRFEHSLELARALADSPYVPESIHTEQRLGFALGVVERAPMLGVSAWSLAQNSYAVHGKLGLEVDFLQAVVAAKAEDLAWEVEISPEVQAVSGVPIPKWVEVRAQRDRKGNRWPVRVARVTADLVAMASWSKEKGDLKPAYRTEAARMMRRRAAARVLTDYPEFKVFTAGVGIYEEEDSSGPVSASDAGIDIQQPGSKASAAQAARKPGMSGVADRFAGEAIDVESEPVEPEPTKEGKADKGGKPGKGTAAGNGSLFGGSAAPPSADDLSVLRGQVGEELWRHACGTHGTMPNGDARQWSPETRRAIATEMERGAKPPEEWRWAVKP